MLKFNKLFIVLALVLGCISAYSQTLLETRHAVELCLAQRYYPPGEAEPIMERYKTNIKNQTIEEKLAESLRSQCTVADLQLLVAYGACELKACVATSTHINDDDAIIKEFSQKLIDNKCVDLVANLSASCIAILR